MKKCLSLLMILASAVSCVYPYDVDLKESDTDAVAFDGNILVGGVSTVKISGIKTYSKDFQGYKENFPGISSLAWVEDEDGNFYNAVSVSPDNVFSIPTDFVRDGLRYRMKARVDKDIYASDWLVPVAPPEIKDISFSLASSMGPSVSGENETMNDVQVSVSLDMGQDATGYVGIYFEETWEFHTDYECMYELDTLRWREIRRTTPYPNYWCWKHAQAEDWTLIDYTQSSAGQVVNYPVWRFPRTDNRNHKLYSVNITAVSLPKEAYSYIKNLSEISSGSGSLFSPNPGEMPSNIICETDPDRQAVGYVLASVSSSKRAFLDNRYLISVAPPTLYLFIPENKRESYEYNCYPVDDMTLLREDGNYVTGLYWGPKRCIDCVVAGGTKERPDYWPN